MNRRNFLAIAPAAPAALLVGSPDRYASVPRHWRQRSPHRFGHIPDCSGRGPIAYFSLPSQDGKFSDRIPTFDFVCYFNGVKQLACVEAHDREGWIRRYRTDEHGCVMWGGPENVERVHGDVRIALSQSAFDRLNAAEQRQVVRLGWGPLP